MGLLDVLTGRRKLAKPAEDRLFAISTAYVTFQTAYSITSRGNAAIVFQSLNTADFTAIVTDMEEVVRATAADSQITVQTHEDSYGYSWLVLQDGSGNARTADAGSPVETAPEGDFDGLVVGINGVSGAIESGGYGERLLCAVFAFADDRDRPLYWIYNYKRGTFYPFVPTGEHERDNERELVLRAQVGRELPVEAELQRWFPLWGIPL
ncbi:MAG: PspA-associated protein PspAB [Solirubrobacteraceae bacterium]